MVVMKNSYFARNLQAWLKLSTKYRKATAPTTWFIYDTSPCRKLQPCNQ